jgi:hypothetical protein
LNGNLKRRLLLTHRDDGLLIGNKRSVSDVPGSNHTPVRDGEWVNLVVLKRFELSVEFQLGF